MAAPLLLLELIPALAKLGVAVIENLPELARQVNARLDEEYLFRKPRRFVGPLNFFVTVRTEQVGPHQYVLEKGMMAGWYYRIRVRGSLFVKNYFVWDRFDSEQQALGQWEGFVTLVKAKHVLDEYLDGSKH